MAGGETAIPTPNLRERVELLERAVQALTEMQRQDDREARQRISELEQQVGVVNVVAEVPRQAVPDIRVW